MLIINAKINTIEAGVINSGFILIGEGKILDMGEMSGVVPKDDDVIDLKGKSLYPGFIDAHTHIGIFEDGLGFEGDDINEMSDPITPELRAIDAVNPLDRCFTEAVKAGVTTVLTGPGSSNPIAGQIVAMKTCGNRMDDMIIMSPVAIKFALGENPKGVYHEKDKSPYTRMATAALIRECLFKAKRYLSDLKKYENDPENFDLPEYDAKCESLIPLLEKKISAHFHAHRADDIFTAIRISKEFDIHYVIVHATEGHLICEELLGEKAKVFSGPFLSERSKPELANLTPESPGIMSRAGIQVSIITDHSVIPIQYLTLCAALAVREGMDYNQALRAITINPAIACGIDDKVGSIAVGKDADFSVFESDPLDFKSKPSMVFINGKLVFNENVT